MVEEGATLIAAQERCIKRPAQSAVKSVKYLSSLTEADQCTALSASESEEGFSS